MGRNGLDASERMSETCCLKMGGMFSFLPLPFLGEPGSNKCFPLAVTSGDRPSACLSGGIPAFGGKRVFAIMSGTRCAI
jgi:hypothetical protein